MSQPHDGVSLIRHDDAILEVRLSRPRVRNALDETTARALGDALRSAAEDGSVRCVILSGDGASFCAGADITQFQDRTGTSASQRIATLFQPALMQMVEMDKPVISAVKGAAAGIGVAYVLASDLVLMGRSAYLKLAFIDIGLIPDGGISWHLIRRLGHARAFELAATASPIDAPTCLALGLANRVVDDARLDEKALSWARRLVSQPPRGIANTKRALRFAAVSDLEDTIAHEGQLQDDCKASAEFTERVTAFLSRRS